MLIPTFYGVFSCYQLSDRTYSLWGNIASHLDEFLNPLYKSEAYPDLLEPNLTPSNILFWRGLYCRFESGVHPRESIADVLLANRYIQRSSCDLDNNKEKLMDLTGTIPLHWKCTLPTCKSASLR